jgi:hypothetical protein
VKTPTTCRKRRLVASLMKWDPRLYVAGPTRKSVAAFRNFAQLCEEHLELRVRDADPFAAGKREKHAG